MTQVRISDAIREVAFESSRELDEVLDTYYAPDYVHRSDGHQLDRAGFANMVAGMRRRVVKGSVTVLDEVYEGSHYAERHRYTMKLIDGTLVDREIYFFATLSEDGRFQRADETGFDVG